MTIIHETPDTLPHHYLRSKDGLQKVYEWIVSRTTKGPHHVLMIRNFSHFRLTDTIWQNLGNEPITEFSPDGSDIIAQRANVVENWLKKHRCFVQDQHIGASITKEVDGSLKVWKVPKQVISESIAKLPAGSLVYYDDDPFEPVTGQALDELRKLLNSKKRIDVILTTYLPRSKGALK